MICCFFHFFPGGSFTSSAFDLLQVVLGLPDFVFPCGFQSKSCLVKLLVCFRRVCPIYVHVLPAVSLLMLCWSVLQISLFVVLSCHLVFRMYLRHLLMNVCSIQVVVFVTLHVSEPHSSTLFTLVLAILILFRVDKDDMFHTVFKMLNACLAFPILFLTSSSVPPLSDTTLPRYVNLLLSSSISFPFSRTLAYCVLFTFCSFVFCTLIFKPLFSSTSAKSRSSNCLVNVHWMSF